MPEAEVFVSYASGDREVAEAIARGLTELGIPTFFDRFSIEVGESVVESVQRGLASAKFGVIVVSPDSLTKNWPRAEVKQLMRAQIEDRTRLLPVWHNVTAAEVREHQPGLEDVWAANTAAGLRAVIRTLAVRIVDANPAVVPLYQRPVERFLNGDGELTLGVEGPTFTIWEALLDLPEATLPMYVEGEVLDRRTLLLRAGETLTMRPQAAESIGPDRRARVVELFKAELGCDPSDMDPSNG